MRSVLKSLLNGLALLLVLVAAGTCRLEVRLRPRSESVFNFWGEGLARVPGLPGVFLRRAFYRLTLEQAAADLFIGYGSMFTHRHARVERGVYIGRYALLGSCRLGEGCLIGSRVSLCSGGSLHEIGADGRWTAFEMDRLEQVEVGAHAWIGEAAVIVARVGAGAMVAAGTVVASAVPQGVMVAGNPARFVRRVQPAETPAPVSSTGGNAGAAHPRGADSRPAVAPETARQPQVAEVSA